MQIQVIHTSLEEIRALRTLFLHESNLQFTYDKCHLYGWADTYQFLADGLQVGYGAIWGQSKRQDRDSIFEYYLLPPYRKLASQVFSLFHTATNAIYIECQSNDLLLTSMLYEFTHHATAEAFLFEDHYTTTLHIPGASFREPLTDPDDYDAGGYMLEYKGQIVAEGGLMLNYNMPYADIYVDVKEGFRQQGFGSLIVQELKKEAYGMGRVPAARCNINNRASKATLLKAGFKCCGFRLQGALKKEPH
jgi:GNAT superfamily N-acetyltransferase